MTYEEAIDYGTSCIDAWGSWVKPDAVQMQFYKMAVASLEKQIPKKPPLQDRMVCPVCNSKAKYGHPYEKYCCHCGQAIDWSDEE